MGRLGFFLFGSFLFSAYPVKVPIPNWKCWITCRIDCLFIQAGFPRSLEVTKLG